MAMFIVMPAVALFLVFLLVVIPVLPFALIALLVLYVVRGHDTAAPLVGAEPRPS